MKLTQSYRGAYRRCNNDLAGEQASRYCDVEPYWMLVDERSAEVGET